MSIHRTGIFDSTRIRGVGKMRGLQASERRVIICEGESHGDIIGDDKVIIEKAIAENQYEIFSCGSKKQVLLTLKELKERDIWKELIAVIDRDEDDEITDQEIVYWPQSRDQESFLIKSEAFIKCLRNLSANNYDYKLRPDVFSTDPFGEVLHASAVAWQVHSNSNNIQYVHPNNLIKCLMDKNEKNIIPIPDNSKKLSEILLEGLFSYRLPEIDNIFMKIQGKRALTLIAAKIYTDTYFSRYNIGINDWQINKLWNDLRVRNYNSRLKRKIIENLTKEDLKNLSEDIKKCYN